MNINKRTFINNLFFTFGVQGLSLLLSVIMNLIVPKILGIEAFGYWQLFIFYGTFIGFSHFGLIDGLYLKYGGIDYKNIDFSSVKSQYLVSFSVQLIICITISVVALLNVNDGNRLFVFFAVCVYMLLFNACNFFYYLFQASNRIKIYSSSVAIDKITLIVCILLLSIGHFDRFEYFVSGMLFSKALSLSLCMSNATDILLAKLANPRVAFFENIRSGIQLMFANIASTLILGCGRFFIDDVWGIETFGKFSFSISLCGFFLLFITQTSIVLFPVLRKISAQKQREIYRDLRIVLGVILLVLLLLYLPIKLIVTYWLPDYSDSLRYLIILLPLCIYDGKMQLLCNTYFKVLRMEKIMLRINFITVCVSALLTGISAYIFKNMFAVVISIVFAVILRNFIADNILGKKMNYKNFQDFGFEFILTLIFTLSFYFIKNDLLSFCLYLLFLSGYLFFSKNKVKKSLLILSNS